MNSIAEIKEAEQKYSNAIWRVTNNNIYNLSYKDFLGNIRDNLVQLKNT